MTYKQSGKVKDGLTPWEFIQTVSNTWPRYPEMSGGCMKFHLLLRDVFPTAGNLMYNSEHIITPIEGVFYDISGVVNPEGYLPIEAYGRKNLIESFRLEGFWLKRFEKWY